MNSNSNNFREMFWDESNRLRVVYDQNSYQMQHYIYDAAGERTLKASSKIENVYENGQVEANTTTMGLYTTYVSPYMVVDANQKYSKHYFNGTQRVASKIGEQDIAIFENGNQYLKQESSKTTDTPSIDFEALKTKQITDFSYYLSKSTNNATAKNVKVNYTEYKKADTNTETTSAKAADNNSTYAAQQYAEIYYYHSDHLGTGTFLSDFDGNPYQFFLNLPFGETMAEQHSYSGEYTNRYKFNGKELDEETGFYYYGARYYNPKFSIWLSVDPLAEEFPNWNPYNYCMQNPINLIDPKGMSPEDGEGDPPSYNGSSFFNGMVHTEGEKSWLRVTGGWSDLTAGTGFIIDSVTVSNKPNGDTVSQRVPNAWEMLRDDSIIGSAVYETVNALTVIPQMCMFRSVSGGTMKSLDGKAMTSEAALMGFVSTGTSFFGGQVSALKAAAPSVSAAKGGVQGGLNLFKWGEKTTTTTTTANGWKAGDYMLHLPNKGTPALNWKANYGALRREMGLGNPIFETFVHPNGALRSTGGFLNAERFTLQSRGWIYNSGQRAWLPPIK